MIVDRVNKWTEPLASIYEQQLTRLAFKRYEKDKNFGIANAAAIVVLHAGLQRPMVGDRPSLLQHK